MGSGETITFASLHFLEEIARNGRPLLFWLGAGMSAWNGHPSWRELAEDYHRRFVATEPEYDRQGARQAIDSKAYPEFFSLTQSANRERYFAILKEVFRPRTIDLRYQRLLTAIRRFSPIRVVTTNVDESLEGQLPEASIVQRSDLTATTALLHASASFVAKLHGSISSVETTVFTREDYEHLVADTAYLAALQHLFGAHSLVVLGSSLSDEYLLTLLRENAAVRKLFGDGPHFFVGPTPAIELPKSFRVLRYDAQSSIGHRAAIHYIESIAPNNPEPPKGSQAPFRSAYFLIDLFPPGLPWTTAQTTHLEQTRPYQNTALVRGLGFAIDEVPAAATTLHDVLVALTCFEKLYAPLETLPKLLYLLGGDIFTQLIRERALELIWWTVEEAISFANDAAATGELISLEMRNPQEKPLTLDERVTTILSLGNIRLLASQYEGFLKVVASATTRIHEDGTSPIIQTINHALRLLPVRRTLGFSKFTPDNCIPRWLAHPVLRAALLTRAAMTCQMHQAASIKFPFGAKTLGNALLAMPNGTEYADAATNYVLYGSFRNALPTSVDEFRALVRQILGFRTTAAAERHRAVVLQYLAADTGADCVAAIDATLKSALPTYLLQESRDQFSELLLPQHAQTPSPALWGDAKGDPIVYWREYARRTLLKFRSQEPTRIDSLCPCGSTVPVENCCLGALSNGPDMKFG